MKTEVMKLYGLTSEACIETITRSLQSIAGVNDVIVSLLRSRVIVQFDESRLIWTQVENALSHAGYSIRGT